MHLTVSQVAGRVLRAVDIGRWCLNKLPSLPREIACIYRGPPNLLAAKVQGQHCLLYRHIKWALFRP